MKSVYSVGSLKLLHRLCLCNNLGLKFVFVLTETNVSHRVIQDLSTNQLEHGLKHFLDTLFLNIVDRYQLLKNRRPSTFRYDNYPHDVNLPHLTEFILNFF